jgi:ribosomal-protein-alanine N-acetyltransferase
LSTQRLELRRWRDDDLAPFAAMNADPEVVEHFLAPLDPAASDAMVGRIEAQFDSVGYGLWAVEVRATGEFIGFTGLAVQTFPAHFTPAVEVGWRLQRSAWGHGYATEAALASLAAGWDAGLTEIVSMTATTNVRSQRVMERIGMTRDPADDFDHPSIPAGHRLQRHVLYRIQAPSVTAPAGRA